MATGIRGPIESINKIIDALGIDQGRGITAIDIHFDCKSLPTLSVTHLVDDGYPVAEAMRSFQLVEMTPRCESESDGKEAANG
jgi:hypothetical protein